MQCVILAGGLGTRMWPDAKTVPKTLLPVAGRPFADWQLEWLAGSGIGSVVYCVGYLGEMVRTHVGDGAQFGIDVHFVDEGEQLRGTAGALRLAADSDLLDDRFLVLYGDSWLEIDPAHVLRLSRESGLPALMTVFRNDGRWDTSNAVVDGARVVRYEKGLDPVPAEMRYIDYGLLAFERDLITERVPAAASADLAPLCTDLASHGLLAATEAKERFYEIGSPEGRREAEKRLLAR